MSEYFPLWITADDILFWEIAPRLGAYASANRDTVNISHLPPDVIYLVPPEDRGAFNRQYGSFAKWAITALDLCNLLEPMLHFAICDATLAKIEATVKARICEYDANNEITFREKFLEFMGISTVCECISFEIEYDKEALQAALNEESPEG